MEEFIGRSQCRRVVMDRVMNGHERAGCEEGEVAYDVCEYDEAEGEAAGEEAAGVEAAGVEAASVEIERFL